MLEIGRRFEKRVLVDTDVEEGNGDVGEDDGKRVDGRENGRREGGEGEAGRGYRSFGELAKDLGDLLDLVWSTGTRKPLSFSLIPPHHLKSIILTLSFPPPYPSSPSHPLPFLFPLSTPAIQLIPLSPPTATLLLPTTLTLSSLLPSTYLPAFPFSPTATFPLLRKLDFIFASLLSGKNIETGMTLPGYEGSLLGARGVDGTSKVRIRGVVERGRRRIVEMVGGDWQEAEGGKEEGREEGEEEGDDDGLEEEDYNMGEGTTTEEDEMETDTDTQTTTSRAGRRSRIGGNQGMETDDLEMQVARVYERTIVALGEGLDMDMDMDLGKRPD